VLIVNNKDEEYLISLSNGCTRFTGDVINKNTEIVQNAPVKILSIATLSSARLLRNIKSCILF